MDENTNGIHEICMIDSLKLLTKDGFTNLCKTFGSIKNITLYKAHQKNHAFIEFEDKASMLKLLKNESDFPAFIKVQLSNRTQKEIQLVQEIEDKEKCEINDSPEIISNENVKNKQLIGQSIYLGPNISGSSIIEETKQLKLKDKIKIYNLNNDDLFGRPLSTKWEKIEMPHYDLNNLDFYYRFENCTGGEIKIEKKLSPSIFTGWTKFFNDGENVQDKLKRISDDIEWSDLLNINDLKSGMLVGAFDSDTNLYGRGYITLIAGNSINVALSDYGRVINTIKIKVLPEKYTKLPAYSLKVYTKGNYVSQLEYKSYVFKVCSVCAERIVLIMFDENKEIKVQLKKWHPTVEESGVSYIDFKSGSSVELLKLKDMTSVYIRSKERHHLDLFFSCWNSLAAYCYKNPRPLNREPLYGEIIGYKSTNTNYVRARVHKYLGDNIYLVKQMDYPVKEHIKLSEMIELKFEHKSMPVSMLKVGLKDALPYPVQYHAKDFVNIMINVLLGVRFDESKLEGWKNVELNINVINENMNAILFGLVEPSWFKDVPYDIGDDTSNFCSYLNLSKKELTHKSVVNMTFVMYYNGIFYMRDKWFGKSFSLLCSMIKEYCSLNLHPYLPHHEEVCLGKFPDGMWYRVVCEPLKPGVLATVHSVDLGTTAFLNSKNMKKIPEELISHPIHVYQCILENSEIDVKKLELLQKYENTDCEFTIMNSFGDIPYYLINCPFLQNILQ